MQSTNIKGIKAALWEQAFIGGTQVSCSMGQVVAMTPTHMIGDTCCKYPLQEKREFDSEDACFVMYCGSSAWQEEQDRRSFLWIRMLFFLGAQLDALCDQTTSAQALRKAQSKGGFLHE